MKKRYIKKFASLLVPKNNDPDCKHYDRYMSRHKRYCCRRYQHWFQTATKKDWYWYYYFQSRIIDGMNHKGALALADKCIEDYEDLRRKKK